MLEICVALSSSDITKRGRGTKRTQRLMDSIEIELFRVTRRGRERYMVRVSQGLLLYVFEIPEELARRWFTWED